MTYGDFDQENREYVIHRPDTPAPWCNYLGHAGYRAIVSNTGGGYSYAGDASVMRVLRDHPRRMPEDRPGRYVYLREAGGGDAPPPAATSPPYNAWSPTWQPVMAALDGPPRRSLGEGGYECRHGMGYTTVRSKRGGIAAEITYVVPVGECLELWIVTVRNESERPRRLDLFSYCEFSLWGVMKDLLNQQASKYVGMVRCEDGVILHETRSDAAGPKGDDVFVLHRAYFGCGRKVESFDVQRAEFIGPWRDESNPVAVERGRCSGKQYCGYDPVASLHLELSLAPGEDDTIVFVLGVDDEGTEWRAKLDQYSKPENARAAVAAVRAHWAGRLDCLQVETPDAGMNAVVNTWNPYQTVNTFLTPRGYRDTSQDVLGIMHMLPAEVRQRLRLMLAHQFQSGITTHDYALQGDYAAMAGGGYLFGDGDLGYASEGGVTLEERLGTPASDSPLWVVPAVCAYIKETGDFDFLRERIPFLDGGASEALDHLTRVLDWSWRNRGLHGLPLIRGMDWNDCLNLPEGSVTVWGGMLFIWAARELAELLARPEVGGDPSEIAARADEMAGIINEVAWDGRWYVRAFFPDGEPLGSSRCEEGQIDHMPQSWSVITGVAPRERAVAAMDSVHERLFTRHGIALIAPPYTRYQPRLGGTSVFPAGLKENGGIFNHPVNWAIIAECLLGRGDRAWEYYQSLLPSTKPARPGNEIADIYQMEPYIFSQFVAGPTHPLHGRAGRAWMTGTAAWALVTASQYILGLRPDYDGLRIDPCLPSEWTGFKAMRVFRGTRFEIEVGKERGACRGVREVRVDGSAIAGNLVPGGRAEKVAVKAKMG